jgi:L-amino acid N-acyltransferase YncA
MTNGTFRIRVADPGRDAERVTDIYRYYVEETDISFEEVAPSADEMRGRMEAVLAWTPWLVAETVDAGRSESDHVIGYAYASRHRERAGYRWSVDISVYIDHAWHRRGVGRALYAALVPILRRQGMVNVYAGIAVPNPASVALHESLGMKQVALYEQVGYKFGTWPDVAWFALRLNEPTEKPSEPTPFPELTPAER